MSPTELAAPAFAAAALGGRILGNGMTSNSLWVALAILITPRHPFFEKPVHEVAMTADLVPLYIETANRALHGFELLDHVLDNRDVLYDYASQLSGAIVAQLSFSVDRELIPCKK